MEPNHVHCVLKCLNNHISNITNWPSLQSRLKFCDMIFNHFFSEFPILKCWAQSKVAAPCALKNKDICQWNNMKYKSVSQYFIFLDCTTSFKILSIKFLPQLRDQNFIFYHRKIFYNVISLLQMTVVVPPLYRII